MSNLAMESSCKTRLPPGRVRGISKSTPLHVRDRDRLTNLLPFQKVSNASKPKARDPTEIKRSNAATKSTSDIPVFTILQRPKNNKASDDLIVKFLSKVDVGAFKDGDIDMNLEISETQIGRTGRKHGNLKSPGDKVRLQCSPQRKSTETVLTKCNSKKGADSITEDSNVVSSTACLPELFNEARIFMLEAGGYEDSGQCLHDSCMFYDPELDDFEHLNGLNQLASTKKLSEHCKKPKKPFLVESKNLGRLQQTIFGNMGSGGLRRLKRATTDPLIMHQAMSHYVSEVVDIPVRVVNLHNVFSETTSMSCPERWAGPSYYSSPAPSSLPLPKFSFQNLKLSSAQSSGEVYIRNVLEAQELGSFSTSPESCPLQEVALDAAFVTKSLRRILKLDPS